jgi:hypothetical protein
MTPHALPEIFGQPFSRGSATIDQNAIRPNNGAWPQFQIQPWRKLEDPESTDWLDKNQMKPSQVSPSTTPSARGTPCKFFPAWRSLRNNQLG